MEGIKRLELEVAELNNFSISKIFNYLKTRTDLYDKFNNEEKTAEGMYDYIYSRAEKHKHNNMAMMDDNVVYMWAITYFTKSNEELGIKKERLMPPSAKEVIKENEKEAKNEPKKEEKPEDNQITLFQEVQK